MNDVLGLRARLAAIPTVVYGALTEEKALRIWLADYASVSLSDKQFEFWGPSIPQGGSGQQNLLATIPDRLLRFNWTLDGKPTTVEIELNSDGDDHTILNLRQDGLPSLEELMAPTGRRDGLHSMHTFWGLALANLAEYVEVRPLTPKADFRPGRMNEIRVRIEIGASPNAVFTSLIDPEQIKLWFGWEVEIDPRTGGRTTFGVEGDIVDFDHDRRIVCSDPEGSTVGWELEGSEGKTLLTFFQTGYTDDEWDNAAQHEAGWLGSLAELKRLHELGGNWTPLISELPT